MKQKLFTFLLALVASVGIIYASDTQVDGIWYNFNESNKTATVTYRGSSFDSYDNEYSGSVVIPSSVTYNGTTYSVTSIGGSAFSSCSSLTSITIPNSVTSVGSEAFRWCSSLTSVTIPNSVTSIGSHAFEDCSSLTSITIPNSVTSIESYTFYYCSSLTSVTIPNSVTSIGYQAFYRCSSLTSVTIPNSVTSIGARAFSGCSSLTSPVYNAHYFACMPTSYSGVYAIPEGIKQIAGGAFCDCSSLISVTIPNSVTSIGEYAFSGCSSLTSINVDSNNPNYSSVDGVLFNKDKTTLVAYPGGKQGAYTIPNSVTSIGSSAFSGCSSFASITIPNSVTSIGSSAFEGCSKLTSITIPNSVTSIGERAFFHCSSLTSVSIGNSVTSIGMEAFAYCSSLTSVSIGNSVTSIGKYAFEETGIYANEDNWENDVLYINDCLISAKESISGAYTIKAGTRIIAGGAFYDCSSLTSITIPKSVTSIGKSAFEYCSKLTSVTIPNSVTSVGEWAFYGCSCTSMILTASSEEEFCKGQGNSLLYSEGLGCQREIQINGTKVTKFTIPNSVTSIGDSAFYYCSSLTSITIPKSVTSIGKSAFWYCESLTSITIPNSVTSIGEEAFYGCKSLTSITIPNSVTSIGEWAFGYCSSLTSITIPNSVTSIESYTFCYCSSLTSVTIPNSVTSIGGGAFRSCSSLTSVTIPNSVTSIGAAAFAYDDALVAINVEQGNRAYSSVDGVLYNRNKTVIIAYPTGKTNNSYTILDGVNTIDSCAFIGNEYIEYINMPKTLISIDYGAFANCTKLIKIVIPKTVRSIGYRAFYNCASLKKIYNNAIIPQEIDDQTFEKVDILNCELYVMPMAFTNYYNANIWKDFGLIETIEIGGIDIDDSKLEFTTTQKQANVLWAANSKATLYLLSMRRVGSEDTYTFTFDENGYLISSDTNSLDFSKLIYLQNAAYSLTITDFDTDATYVYSFLYKDNEGNILHSESGQFSPAEFPEGIEDISSSSLQGGDRGRLILRDGQVLILRNGKTYTMQGQEVK